MTQPASEEEGFNDTLRESSLLELHEILDEADLVSSPNPNAVRSKSKRRVTLSPILGRRILTRKRSSLGENAAFIEPKRIAFPDEPESLTPKPSTSEAPKENICGLPQTAIELLEKNRGISELYPWQKECLSHPAVDSGGSLIVSLPTSGGKTLVAEILILRKILVEEQDALLVLPYVSIVQEKIKAFTPLGLELGFTVEEYAGGRGRIPPIRHRRKRVLYVATIERAASLLNSLLEMGRLQSHLGLVVVDELHMIGDGSRGVTLEQLLTRLRVAHPSCQIVGMSATLSNVKDLAAFLNAQVYESDYRPVKLTERVKIGDSVYKVPTEERDGDLEFERKLSTHFKSAAAPNFGPDSDRLVDLVSEIVPDSSCLVFCPSKNNAENVAKLLAKALFPTMSKVKVREKKEMLQTLQREGDERVCPLLQRCIPSGVAYHHSGLTAHERSIVQEAYLEGTLCIICCTSTLAAGVNLPAKRVIIRSPLVGTAPMSSGQYKQMSGRAGRAGLDSEGESILILPNDASKTKYMNILLKNGVVPAKSQLSAQGGAGIRSLILSAVSLGLAFNQNDLMTLAKKTFLACQVEPEQVASMFNDGLDVLFEKKLLRLETDSGALSISKLGKAVTKASIDMEAVESIYEELTVASQCTVLSSYLHLLYISVPTDFETLQTDMNAFERQFRALTKPERKLCEMLGITELCVEKELMYQGAPSTVKRAIRKMGIAFLLRDLWNQRPIWDLAQEYQVNRGTVQNLAQAASAFAGSLSRFCEDLDEFWALKRLLPDFSRQLMYCTHPDLIPLMELQGVRHARARQLFNAGYKTLTQLAKAEPRDLVHDVEHLSRGQAQAIVGSAKMLVQERMEALLEEADSLMGGV